MLIEVGGSDCFLCFALKKEIKSLLFILNVFDRKTLYVHFSLLIVLDADARASFGVSRLFREQVPNLLIVNFKVTN